MCQMEFIHVFVILVIQKLLILNSQSSKSINYKQYKALSNKNSVLIKHVFVRSVKNLSVIIEGSILSVFR